MKTAWLAALATVEPFDLSRPPGELGFLYYSGSKRAFVDPREVKEARPHFSRPRGVLPLVLGS